MNMIYTPDRSLIAKVNRRVARFQARRLIPVNLERPIVSFSFDDCPKSAMAHALKPLENEGWLATIYMACGLCETTNHLGLHMSFDDIKAVHASGHEIGDHTFSHEDGSQLPLGDVLADIDKNQASLNALGVPASQTFAYPYGQLTPALKTALRARFIGARGIHGQTHASSVDLNQIASYPLYQGSDFEVLLRQIAQLRDNPGWLTIFTHDIRDNPSDFGCTPAQMRAVIQAVKETGAQVLTIADAIQQLERTDA